MNRLKTFIVVSALVFVGQTHAIEVNKDASINDANTTVMGVNHIGLSVKDLGSMLSFYQQASGFELLERGKVSRNRTADRLYGKKNVSYEFAVLKAPNMLLELREFSHNKNESIRWIPAIGPGMTHTCFQSPASQPGWQKFMDAGAVSLTRGGEPVDLGGYGVTYGYAYDPEGNMIELEQLDGTILARAGYDPAWVEQNYSLWMSQVALATHDIDNLMGFYKTVLGFEPYRVAEVKNNPKADQIVGTDNMHAIGGWFRMNNASKVLEFWQYVNPETQSFTGKRDVTSLGYSFSLEVGDIQTEYKRLKAANVEFVSKPVKHGAFWQVYAHDPDGNVFSLRQAIDPDSDRSVASLDKTQ